MCEYCKFTVQSPIFGQYPTLRYCDDPCEDYRQFVRDAYIDNYVRKMGTRSVRDPTEEPDDPALPRAGEGLLPFYGLSLQQQMDYVEILQEKVQFARRMKIRRDRLIRRRLVVPVGRPGAERSPTEELRGRGTKRGEVLQLEITDF